MIQLILGPMFSGKTTEMLRRLTRASIAGKKVALLRPYTDTRAYLTHDMEHAKVKEYFVDWIPALDKRYTYDVIGIDEAQFFTYSQFCHDVNNLALNGVTVILSGLSGTSEREPFDAIQQLIPHAEEITKLNAVCKICGSDYGSFSYFLNGDKDEDVKVGGSELYTALCRVCYFRQSGGKLDE